MISECSSLLFVHVCWAIFCRLLTVVCLAFSMLTFCSTSTFPSSPLYYQTTQVVRRILTSQYWVFSPNWICHSKPPLHTITSLRPIAAGPDTTTQSRYMWMVGIPLMGCVCVWVCLFVYSLCVWLHGLLCDCAWLPFLSLFSTEFIPSCCCSRFISITPCICVLASCCCSQHIMTCLLLHRWNQTLSPWWTEFWTGLCCCSLLHPVHQPYLLCRVDQKLNVGKLYYSHGKKTIVLLLLQMRIVWATGPLTAVGGVTRTMGWIWTSPHHPWVWTRALWTRATRRLCDASVRWKKRMTSWSRLAAD